MTSEELISKRKCLQTHSLLGKHNAFATRYRNLQLALKEIAKSGESGFRIIDAKWNSKLMSLCITNYAGKLKLHKDYRDTYNYLAAQSEDY